MESVKDRIDRQIRNILHEQLRIQVSTYVPLEISKQVREEVSVHLSIQVSEQLFESVRFNYLTRY
jgi:hypothetical protein